MLQHALPRLSFSILLSFGLVGSQAGAMAQKQSGADAPPQPTASTGAALARSPQPPHANTEVSPQDKSQAGLLFGSAQNLMWTNPQGALAQIKEAMRLNPQGGYRYQSLLAQCLARTGKQEEALKEMRAAVKSDPTDYSLLELYNILRDMGRTQEGVDALQVSKKSREVPGLYIQALQFLREQDRLKDGMALADMALEGIAKKVNNIPSDITGAYTLKGDILLLQGKPKEAQEMWRKVIDLPMKSDYWMHLARVHLAGSEASLTGTQAEAAVAAAALLQDGPSTARRHWLKSREYGKVKDLPAQIFELKEASRLDPEHAYYHYELSQILGQLDLKVEELAELLAAARVANEDTYVLYASQALKAADRPEEAIALAKQGALKSEHRSAQLYILLGNYYLEKGDYAEALKMTDLGFEVEKAQGNPDFLEPALYLLKGDILHKQNKNPEAHAAWQKAADFPNKVFPSVQEAQSRLNTKP